jgi:hypothetical protein
LYWISFQNFLIVSFLSLATLIIFLVIAILLAQPRNTKKVVHISRIEPKKAEPLRGEPKETKEEPKEKISVIKPMPVKTLTIKKEPKKAEKELIRDRYIGSTQTKTYHKSSCRLAKLIKPKFKLSNDKKTFFKNYKACKVCLKK